MGLLSRFLHQFKRADNEPLIDDDDRDLFEVDADADAGEGTGEKHLSETDTKEIDLKDIGAISAYNGLAPRQEPDMKRTVNEEHRETVPLPDRALFKTLLDNLPSYVYFKDCESRFVMVSKSYAEKIFSLSDVEKTKGRTDFDFFPRDYAVQSFEVERQIMATGKPEIAKEIMVTWPYGNITWLLNSTFPLTDEYGKSIGTWGISLDITAQKHAEEELNASAERLRQSQKMEAFGQLAGGIAHDFNNMLNIILGSAQLVELSLADDKSQTRDNIAMVIDTSKQAAELAQQLLSFARKDSSKIVELDIHDVVHSVVGLLQHTIDKRIHIVERLNAPRSSIKGDYIQLQNALLNLSINARDAMPDGGTLTFSTDVVGPAGVDAGVDGRESAKVQQARYVRVMVSDTGTGMDEKTKHRAFEPFFTTKEPGKGTGLGLASVYGTVKSHSGLIEFESEVNKGTKFHLYFPLIKNPFETADDQKGMKKGEGTILIVDDEESVRFVLTEMLTDIGYSPVVKKNGNEAIEYYRGRYREVDAIIVDLVMPGISGNECIRALKQINPDALIFISSGYSLVSETQQIISKGIAGFLQKPFEMNELSRMLSDALANK